MRWARSYSIIDHQILHGGYLNRLSHESMVLYLFLVVVGDRQGRSFYSDRLITEVLRLSCPMLDRARKELVSEGLINYRMPYWEVKNISQRRNNARDECLPTMVKVFLIKQVLSYRETALPQGLFRQVLRAMAI